jgi:hypothetical protein
VEVLGTLLDVTPEALGRGIKSVSNRVRNAHVCRLNMAKGEWRWLRGPWSVEPGLGPGYSFARLRRPTTKAGGHYWKALSLLLHERAKAVNATSPPAGTAWPAATGRAEPGGMPPPVLAPASCRVIRKRSLPGCASRCQLLPIASRTIRACSGVRPGVAEVDWRLCLRALQVQVQVVPLCLHCDGSPGPPCSVRPGVRCWLGAEE